jgi:uncharacterized metal-binding protein
MDINFVKEFNNAWYTVGLKLSKREMDGGMVRYCVIIDSAVTSNEYIVATKIEKIVELANRFNYKVGVDFSEKCLDIYLNNN